MPVFRKWLAGKPQKPSLLIEPFTGGGIISLTALFENLAEKALMAELDEQVAAVWQAVAEGDAEWLADKIINFDLTHENAKAELNKKHEDTKAIAFQTILKNRIFHGGILAEGSGLIKYGEQGKGILSRWYPQTLAKRFRNLNMISGRMEFNREDGLEIISAKKSGKDIVFFIDPPYTAGGKKAGKRLYKYFDIDHERLFEICEQIRGDFLMTYDNADEVKELARKHKFQMKPIAMKNTHHANMTELVIGKDLSWMNGASSGPRGS